MNWAGISAQASFIFILIARIKLAVIVLRLSSYNVFRNSPFKENVV